MAEVKYVTMIDYWVVGIPLSSYAMFKLHLSCEGLWFGPTIACALNYMFYEICIRK